MERDEIVGQQRLWIGAPESVAITASCTPGQGWTLTVSVRRQFESWADAATGHYDFLTTEELADVVAASLAAELEL